MRYFVMTKSIYLFVDGHITWLGAILSQGNSITTSKPVVIASRTTHNNEKQFPQIDFEATWVDFALCRFRYYIVGAPDVITVVTDHKPLCSIFNGKRKGYIYDQRR